MQGSFKNNKSYLPKGLDISRKARLFVIGACQDFGVEGHVLILEAVNSR
jgi:hypothetical protein